MILLLAVLAFGEDICFTNATIYDAELGSLREGVTVTLRNGRMTAIDYEPVAVPDDVQVVADTVILPHLTDFYSLIQERGFGHDEDFSAHVQGRIGRYFREIGIAAFRDPVFPPGAVSAPLDGAVSAYAMRGYLDLVNGPAQGFSHALDPLAPIEETIAQLPDDGPLTFYWTEGGSDRPLLWAEHRDWLTDLVAALRERGRVLGAFIQDASRADLKGLHTLELDFYEGVPLADVGIDEFPEDLVWVPLASLNDKRYCAAKLATRINTLSRQGLYDTRTLTLAQDRLDVVASRIAGRCGVWKKRRYDTLKQVEDWLEEGGKVALGAGGGHLFSFSGDILSELEALDGLGATQTQLLAAAFVHTPALLGYETGYLRIDAPANFIVYSDRRHWAKQIGRTVRYNFQDGKRVDRAGDVTLLK